ncbi:BQ5605_C019g08842 [Microbotryum silenes-dioicae]|uniref:BQ5605_C019g08842 protein n=1 Tax=Microbotryum silenes-dioicae TaxID=796604 RepID=A0A2X0NZC5_9BASI|nr:BQ5605_C019g08842 [Microbotryum silenes-dioicae]
MATTSNKAPPEPERLRLDLAPAVEIAILRDGQCNPPAAVASIKPARSSSPSTAFNPVMPIVEALREGSWKRADQAVLRNEIMPRVLLSSTTDLIEEVFDIPRTHFELMWHRAGLSGVAQDAQGSHLVRFRKDLRFCKARPRTCRLRAGLRVLRDMWCHAHHKRPHEFRLSAAVAQRPYRIGVHDELNDYDEYTDVKDLPSLTTPFLTCARDAPSSPSGATIWNRVMAMVAVDRSPYDAGDEVHAPELVRLVFDVIEHVLAQPSWLYAPGLAINENVAYLVVLDLETHHGSCVSTFILL